MINGVGSGSSYYEQMLLMLLGNEQKPNPFEENDADGDGFLNAEEVGAFASQISEMTGREVDAEELLTRLDTDEDGQVSEEEFEAGRPKGPPPPMMSGTGGDIMALLSKLGSSDTEESEEDEDDASFNSLDTNGDGIVDAQELLAGLSHLIQAYQAQEQMGSIEASDAASGIDLQV